MKARLLLRERRILGEDRFAEMVVWQLPNPSAGSPHSYKYRLAFVVDDVCVVRFDNEAGKGDHKHVDGAETPYLFTSPAVLIDDFLSAIQGWRPS